MEVDVQRKRIALSMRLDDTPGEKTSGGGNSQNNNRNNANKAQRSGRQNSNFKDNVQQGTMAALFEQALKKK